ncbi:hypothetical protein DUT90_08615 [Polaribacter sp. WD7]|uniref:hypothetical protein n=1 Tax=Polaribacter sp. WD7 TaxID=2269061 RepID=UPI000DF4B43D|nr:hypothetical protein [Polaribacter sp. WD7]RCS27157.1 hypothetical protein DUT90_08615 [Polaribacter sp. WD7]
MKGFVLMLLCLLFTSSLFTQSLHVNFGFLVKAKIQLGNQNQALKVSANTLIVGQYKNVSLESGLSFFSGYLFKKHNIKTKGFHYGYDVFLLSGIGNNNNLLGSSFFEDPILLGKSKENQRFYGLGFGFEKEFLPQDVSDFNQRLGKFLIRLSQRNQSFNVQFKNDFRAGKIFNGQGTDFGATGSLTISYSNIENLLNAYYLGVGLSLFTPLQDYSKTPNNPINSDDGSKNVWHLQEPHTNTFYANAFVFGGFVTSHFSSALKVGVNSKKIGAYVQNKLHDSFGLNPRFPWDVAAKDKLFIEWSALTFSTLQTND